MVNVSYHLASVVVVGVVVGAAASSALTTAGIAKLAIRPAAKILPIPFELLIASSFGLVRVHHQTFSVYCGPIVIKNAALENGLRALLAGSYANHVVHRQHRDLAVTEAALARN